MSQDTENFDSLRRLLAIKRHEQPPPGYFHHFSGEVVVRIKAGERGEDAHGYIWQMGWLQRVWSAFESRPALAGALGVAICGLVVFGVISADNDKVNLSPVTEMQSSGLVANNDLGDSLSGNAGSVDLGDKNPIHATMASVNAQPSLFDLVPKPQVEQTSLRLNMAPQ